VDDSRKLARYTLAILFAINLLNFYDRIIFSAVAEPIRKEWSLSDGQVGWLAAAFSLLYAVVGVPLGRLSDRWKRPLVLSWGIAVWSLLTAVSGIARGYWSLFAARLGVGVGEAACAPAANSLIGDLYPAPRRARALAIFMIGLPLGSFFGSWTSGFLAARYGWRMAFYVACVPGFLLAALAMRLGEPARGAAEGSPLAGRTHEGSPYWSVLRIPTIRWIIITGALFNFNMYTIQTFLPAFLGRFHLVDLWHANFITGIAFGAVGVPGMWLGGLAADRMAAVRSSGRLLVSASALFLTGSFIFLALNLASGQLLLFGVLMSIGCLFGYFYYSGVYATIQDIVPPRLRGTAMALYFLAMYLMGGSYGPVMTGKLSDYFARRAMAEAGVSVLNEHFRAAGLHSAMYVIPLCSVLVAAVLLIAARTVARDMNEMKAWMASPERALPARLQNAEQP
jgi:MFS family permease